MAIEEQTQQGFTFPMGALSPPQITRGGQRLTISARSVEKLRFWLKIAVGSPVGDIKFNIYAVDDDELLASKVLFDASSLTGTFVEYEVTFNSPVVINEEVRIVVVKDTDLSDGDFIHTAFINSDVKASEQRTHLSDGSWIDNGSADFTYSYTYTALAGPTKVSTLPLTDISGATATGNGLIDDTGASSVSEHGHVWKLATTPHTSPDTSDSKTTLGAGTEGVPFTSSITGLSETLAYVVAAYATNTEGTTIGGDIVFIAGSPGTQLGENGLATVQTRLHYTGEDGKEYWIQGTLV